MQNKERLRKKYFSLRKKKYFDINPSFFNPLLKLIRSRYFKKNINLSIYYPSSYEVNVIKLLDIINKKKVKIILPVINDRNSMHFYNWKKGDILYVNKYGMLEPNSSSRKVIPNVMLVPLLAFDNKKNRLGYGGGYYDRYLNKYLKKNKNLLTIGVAFSFQEHNKIPISNSDVKLNYVLTEKGFV
tara:strand:- start:259 stop:813 length:555 start_codon:yes stop_codon:yes gene_type:complete